MEGTIQTGGQPRGQRMLNMSHGPAGWLQLAAGVYPHWLRCAARVGRAGMHCKRLHSRACTARALLLSVRTVAEAVIGNDKGGDNWAALHCLQGPSRGEHGAQLWGGWGQGQQQRCGAPHIVRLVPASARSPGCCLQEEGRIQPCQDPPPAGWRGSVRGRRHSHGRRHRTQGGRSLCLSWWPPGRLCRSRRRCSTGGRAPGVQAAPPPGGVGVGVEGAVQFSNHAIY